MKKLVVPSLVAAAFISSGITGYAKPVKKQDGKKPNIIIIYTDDMGYADLACYGSKINRTSNIDQMAKEGIQMTSLYSASPLSSPSRAALLTGRYPNRMGIGGVFFPGSPTGMPASEITMAEALKDVGYKTALVGKWHLGNQREFMPVQQGFDEYFGVPYSNDMIPCIYYRNNDHIGKTVNQDSITYTYTQEALKFIQKNKENPFFLYLAHNMPHVPLGASPNFKGKSPNGLYSDVIEELDWGVGEVLKELDKQGIAENTIVIFSSDNGPWLSEGPFAGSAAPFSQGKNTNWEGAQRVPGIVRWKGTIKPNQVNTDVTVMVDWFPTLVGLAGGKIPTDRVIDGEDISHVLLGNKAKNQNKNQDFIYLNLRSQFMGIRSGDWKILLPEKEKVGNYWEADVPAHDTVLFNLKNDIEERVDLKSTHKKEFALMKEKLEKAKESMKDCPKPMYLFEINTMAITGAQRNFNILKAEKEGVKPKSDAGEAALEAVKGSQKQGQYLMKMQFPF